MRQQALGVWYGVRGVVSRQARRGAEGAPRRAIARAPGQGPGVRPELRGGAQGRGGTFTATSLAGRLMQAWYQRFTFSNSATSSTSQAL